MYVSSLFTNSVYTIKSNGSTQKLSIDAIDELFNNPSNLPFLGSQPYITNQAIVGTGSVSVVKVQHVDGD